MPVSFANSEPTTTGCFDIRTRLLISLAVSGVGLYLNQAVPLIILSLGTFAYVLSTRRYKLIAIAYLLVGVMSLLSIVIILLFFQGVEFLMASFEVGNVAMVVGVKRGMIANFYIPFLRMIPSLNVLLVLVLDFQVQPFVAVLKSIRLPRIIILPLMVFCRFIPELIHNIRQLRDAVRLRGFHLSPLGMLLHPRLLLRLTLVPLVIRALRMTDNLAMAAEMKRIGYAKKPTLWKTLRFRRRDGIVLGVAVLILIGAVIWQLSFPEANAMKGMHG